MIHTEDIIALARQAGEAILEVYHSDTFDIESKADTSPLTRADKMSNQVICDGLLRLDPSIPIVSEENKEIPYAERAGYTRLWLVDPLDGTKEFIKRNGEFTVNIALIEHGRPVLGVVYVPVTGDMYSARQGEGAFHEKDGQVTRLEVNTYTRNDAGLGVVCSRSHLNPETQAFVDSLRNPVTVSRGSSLKFMLIATGAAHLYPRIAPTMEWDTAAAQCVVEEAGGYVIEFDTHTPLVYNKENLLNPYFLAGGKEH